MREHSECVRCLDERQVVIGWVNGDAKWRPCPDCVALTKGAPMRECRAEGCPHPAPGYNDFCDQHGDADWRCECGDLNRMHEAFCYRCGAGQPEDAYPAAPREERPDA